MNAGLIKQQSGLPIASTLQQTGKNNLHVVNEAGGVVNVNYNINGTASAGGNSAEQMMAIQSFSREYYQLIVTCEEDVFSTNMVTVMANRALTKPSVPTEIFERCSTLSESGIEELKRIPAIICNENTALKGETDPHQWAMYAYIRKIRPEGKQIKVIFQPIMPIPQQMLCNRRNAVFFDLNMDCAITDLNYSAWTVRKVNLFEAFRESGIQNVPAPMEAI